MKDKKIKTGKRFKYTTMSAVITVIFIVAVVLLNVVANMLENRVNSKVDLSGKDYYKLDEETTGIIDNLTDDVIINVLMKKDDLSSNNNTSLQLRSQLDAYENESDKITVKYIDTVSHPEQIEDIKANVKSDLSTAFAVVECNGKYKVIDQSGIFSQDSNTNNVYSNFEQLTSTAILYVTQEEHRVATILSISPVVDVSALTDLLNKNGFEVNTVSDVTSAIDENTDLLIVPAPQTDYPETLVDNIETFLFNNGELDKHMIYIPSIYQKDTPNIDKLLADYGLQVTKYRPFDTNTNNMYQSNYTYGMYLNIDSEDPFISNMQNKDLVTIVPMPLEVKVLFDSKDSRIAMSLLKTSDSCILVAPDSDGSAELSADKEQSCSVMAIGSQFKYNSDDTKNTSDIIVIGSDGFLSSTALTSSNFNNADYIMCIFNTLMKVNNSIYIAPKNVSDTTLQITQAQAQGVNRVTMFGIPFVIIVIGIVVFIRRRRK